MKKLWILMVVLTATLPFVTFAQGYTSELQSAYSYAHSIGITTMPSIDQANMYGNLIRAHMAKMMVNYAKNVLGKTPDTSLPCNFTDVANQSTELKGYIKEACQMGLMGQGITAFTPNGVVTRAQFGTVLSRALRGNIFDGATPYHKDHLQALKDAGIMTKIDTPNANEVRGWVMVMMMRVVEGGGSDTTCDTPENQFYCSLGLDLCPSQCRPGATTAGTLSLQKTSDSYDSADDVYLGSFQLTASSSAITLNNIKLQVSLEGAICCGAGTIRLEKDGVRITPKTTPASDNTAVLTVSNLQIPQGQSTTLHIVSTNSASNLRILNTASISSSAASVSASFPITF